LKGQFVGHNWTHKLIAIENNHSHFSIKDKYDMTWCETV